MKKRIDMKIVSNRNTFDRLVAKPNFTGAKVYNENLAGVTLKKIHVELNKPIYAGFTILEISKYHMQKFYRVFTEKLYKPNQVSLLMTDTDSYMFHVLTSDLYRDLKSISTKWLDTSNYPINHPLYHTGNKLNELPPNSKNGFIKEFCGLKSKMYSLKTTEDDEPIMKAKGINKVALSGIKHNDYLKCLKSFHQQETTVQSVRSYSHRIYSTVSKKSSLNEFDDKRYLLCDNITTLPFGHYKCSCDEMLSDELDTEYGVHHHFWLIQKLRPWQELQ